MRNRKYTLPLVVAATVAGVAAGCGSSGGSSSTKASSGSSGGGSTSTNATNVFQPVGSLATGRTAHTATWIPSVRKVLVVGGRGKSGTTDVVLDSAELFDPVTGRFTPTQGRLQGGRQSGMNGRMNHAAVALPNGRVVIIGGQTDIAGNAPLNSLEVFDANASTAQFGSVSGTLTEAKSEPIVFSYQSGSTTEVAIAGGRSGVSNTPLGSVNFYRADSNSVLSQGATLRAATFGGRALPISSATNSQWVIAGGVSTSSGFQAVAGFQVFDPTTRTFLVTNSSAPGSTNTLMSNNVAGFDAALAGSGRIMTYGGRDQVSSTAPAVNTIEYYDAATNAWSAATEHLFTARQGHTATRLSNGDVLVIGGTSANGQVLATAELITGEGASAHVIQLTSTLRTARKNHTATLIQMQQGLSVFDAVLVVGGEDAAGNPVATAEVFAPASVSVGVTQPGVSAAPVITSLTPNNGPVGTAVTILGSNFASAASDNIVLFNGIVTPVQSALTGELHVLVPQGAQTGNVTVSVGGYTSNAMTFTVNSATTGGSTGTGSSGGTVFSGPPRIFILLPSSGGSFMPLGIGGSNFDTGAIPYVNSTPSLSLFNFSVQNIPLIGSVSVGFTIVPPGAPSGNGDVTVEYNGQRSNPFPFTKN